MRPLKCYFICFTVRSGSTLLSQLLADTGIAGQPKEHFYHNIAPDNPRGDCIPDYRGYLERVLSADTTTNGVFGSKVGGGYWNDFVRRLRAIDGIADLPHKSVLDHLFPDLRYLHLTRRNKVRQAVSPLAGDSIRPLEFAGYRQQPGNRAMISPPSIICCKKSSCAKRSGPSTSAENGIRPFVINPTKTSSSNPPRPCAPCLTTSRSSGR